MKRAALRTQCCIIAVVGYNIIGFKPVSHKLKNNLERKIKGITVYGFFIGKKRKFCLCVAYEIYFKFLYVGKAVTFEMIFLASEFICIILKKPQKGNSIGAVDFHTPTSPGHINFVPLQPFTYLSYAPNVSIPTVSFSFLISITGIIKILSFAAIRLFCV